ncbi:hypothetical protein ABW19_dt0201392 [Dactylella cylindrospora]|nr:hypothetical protein ABW19_dt0201392 [Dactylella cylindrospora]
MVSVYQHVTNTSYTIFFSRNATNFDTIARLYDKNDISACHPTHAASLFADSVRSACELQHDWLATNLVKVEMMSGFQSYSYPYNVSIVEFDEEEERLDFVTSLQILKRISDGNNANSSRRKNLSAILKEISAFSDTVEGAIFAMPMFDWDATASDLVISHRFWVYWAISLPLTCIVLGGTVFWTWWKQRLRQKEDADAKAELFEI